ncbi:MAG: esterase [Candidatus Zixiibacteriota bacterium]|nr:MAG: esterase [candidate division Zixibacteria bacterium]
MSTLRITCLVIAVTAFASLVSPPASQAQRGRGKGPEVVSPEVSADGQITFRILAPKAESVQLTGGDIPEVGQGKEMTKDDDGVWEVTLGPVGPGAYRYRFNVDDVPTVDPQNPSTSESNSTVWSLVCVPGSDFMDTKNVPHGALSIVTYYSSSLDRPRRMHIYTPPGYESGEGKYPVFYLLHGASDSDASWTTVGRAQFILDNLIAAKKAKPMIVVMPNGHTSRFRWGNRLSSDDFIEDFVNDIKPYVEKNYRVYTNSKNRAIAGLSMGGAQTLNIAIPHLGDYSYIGVFSSGIFGITGRGPGGDSGPSWEERHKEILDNDELKKDLELFWFAIGEDDFLLETSQATVEMLKKHGFEIVSKETSRGHVWLNWRDYLHEFAQKLFK